MSLVDSVKKELRLQGRSTQGRQGRRSLESVKQTSCLGIEVFIWTCRDCSTKKMTEVTDQIFQMSFPLGSDLNKKMEKGMTTHITQWAICLTTYRLARRG